MCPDFGVSTALKGHTMKKKINHLKLLFAITAFFVSCQSQPEQIPGYEKFSLNPNFEADVQTVNSMLTACFAGDVAGMETWMHPHYMSYGPGHNREETRQETIDGWVNFARRFENTQLANATYYSFIIDDKDDLPELNGAWLVLWGNVIFTERMSGSEIHSRVHLAFRVNNGKVEEGNLYYDNLSLNEQLGWKLVPPEN
ncbi:MAG: nuclear transport factor 2 family protein [Bacteroidetes bacterium]|nr:MAG: nuclear transport factor 2 family protein [Bacteroidota bacterium]